MFMGTEELSSRFLIQTPTHTHISNMWQWESRDVPWFELKWRISSNFTSPLWLHYCCDSPATITFRENLSLPLWWQVYFPESVTLTENRDSVAPLFSNAISPQSLFPFPTVHPFHFQRCTVLTSDSEWYVSLTVLSIVCPVFTIFPMVVGATVEVSPLLVFELFPSMLTFSPSTVTWPLQVRTSLLPGDKTNTPGGGSAQKNKRQKHHL